MEGSWDRGKLRLKFIPFASRSYENLVLSLNEESTQYSLEEMAKNSILKKGGQNIYRLVLQGSRPPELVLLTERLKRIGNISEVLDESVPAYDLEELERRFRGTLIGDYIGHFSGRDLSLVEEKALYHGLQALLETGIINQ